MISTTEHWLTKLRPGRASQQRTLNLDRKWSGKSKMASEEAAGDLFEFFEGLCAIVDRPDLIVEGIVRNWYTSSIHGNQDKKGNVGHTPEGDLEGIKDSEQTMHMTAAAAAEAAATSTMYMIQTSPSSRSSARVSQRSVHKVHRTRAHWPRTG